MLAGLRRHSFLCFRTQLEAWEMDDFTEKLLLTLLNGLGIGAILALLGYWFQKHLASDRARNEFVKAVAENRAKQYEFLWGITEQARRFKDNKPSPDDRKNLSEELTKWYYGGGAMYLSFVAVNQFFKTRKYLLDETRCGNDIWVEFSRLRTEMKHDCGIYNRKEADTPIPEAN